MSLWVKCFWSSIPSPYLPFHHSPLAAIRTSSLWQSSVVSPSQGCCSWAAYYWYNSWDDLCLPWCSTSLGDVTAVWSWVSEQPQCDIVSYCSFYKFYLVLSINTAATSLRNWFRLVQLLRLLQVLFHLWWCQLIDWCQRYRPRCCWFSCHYGLWFFLTLPFFYSLDPLLLTILSHICSLGNYHVSKLNLRVYLLIFTSVRIKVNWIPNTIRDHAPLTILGHANHWLNMMGRLRKLKISWGAVWWGNHLWMVQQLRILLQSLLVLLISHEHSSALFIIGIRVEFGPYIGRPVHSWRIHCASKSLLQLCGVKKLC